MEKAGSFFKNLNYSYRLLISFCTGPELRPNIFHPQFIINRYMRKTLKESAGFARGVMLDLGCGTKPYYRIFKEHVKAYYGLDILTYRKPQGFITNEIAAPDIFGDVIKLPFSEGRIDTILCTQVLEHIRQPHVAISEFHRILRRGGYIILTCPQAYPIHDKEHDYYRFTYQGITYLLGKEGFKAEKVLRHGGFFAEQALMFNIYFNYNFFKEGEGISTERVLLSILKIIFTPILLLSNAFVNLLGIILDKFDSDLYFTHNYTVIAQRI